MLLVIFRVILSLPAKRRNLAIFLEIWDHYLIKSIKNEWTSCINWSTQFRFKKI
jgi:hypothetical protein